VFVDLVLGRLSIVSVGARRAMEMGVRIPPHGDEALIALNPRCISCEMGCHINNLPHHDRLSKDRGIASPQPQRSNSLAPN
jgi:hypothetical protein